MGDWLKWALVSLVQFVVGKRFYIAAARALRNGSTNMDVLVALGTSASYFYSVCALLYGAVTGFWSPTYFETSAMLITFVLLGKYLECLAKGKTSDAIKKLVELAPATAVLIVKDKGMYSYVIFFNNGGRGIFGTLPIRMVEVSMLYWNTELHRFFIAYFFIVNSKS